MHAKLSAVEYFLPEAVLGTSDLEALFPAFPIREMAQKTGILNRHVASASETASDLALAAAQKLFGSGVCEPAAIDFLILCTQSGDYALPSTACILQTKLGISVTAGAFDYNLGCSGFIYGLGLAEGLICSGQASTVLLLTADTYTKYLHADDRRTRLIFGDGAAATLITSAGTSNPSVGPFVYGTDGTGWDALYLPNSGCRRHPTESRRSLGSSLIMQSNRVFDFVCNSIPPLIKSLLQKAQVEMQSIDLFVFHQANRYILLELADILQIPSDRIYMALSECGNTVSSSIPIALKCAMEDGRLFSGACVLLVGFGVGFSCGATIIRWS